MSMLIVTKYIRLLDLRRGVALATIFDAAAFVVYGVSQSFPGYCIAASLSGLSHGLGGMVPISILINRWFKSRTAFALGICSTGSGIAAILMPPIVTALIHATSLRITLLSQSAFIFVIAIVLLFLLRSRPEDMGLMPYQENDIDPDEDEITGSGEVGRDALACMIISIVLMGGACNAGNQHVPIHYATEGFDSIHIAYLLAFSGIVLTVAKVLFGYITDRFGAYKSGIIFYVLLASGMLLCCFPRSGGMPVALVAMACLGLGLPLSTVGISMFARDIMSETRTYGRTVRNFQFFYMFGALAFGPIPGMIADAIGHYTIFYVIMGIVTVGAMSLMALSYKGKTRKECENEQ
jgi:sugar phosphate permease